MMVLSIINIEGKDQCHWIGV